MKSPDRIPRSTSWFQVLEQVSPPVRLKFRVIETYVTIDGQRSRICDGVWATRTEAEDEIKQRLEKEQP